MLHWEILPSVFENIVLLIKNVKIVDERAITLNEMDAELRAKERLADLFKASFEAAQAEVESLKESESKLQVAVQESEIGEA